MIKKSLKTGRRSAVVAIIVCLSLAAAVLSGEQFRIAKNVLDRAEAKYGANARTLLLSWEKLIRQDTSASDRQKLEKVNRFFNAMTFVDDAVHWRQKDYWATPIEFLASQGGDCEDFSIAKYFTLKEMGIPEKKLNLAYVKALQYNMHHMVLTYYPSPGAEPLVLDNLIGLIKPASQRTDLLPIFSFNGTGLWLAKQRGKGKLAGSSGRLKQWKNLLQKMAENKL